jgi:hypothetical protein
MYHHSMQVSSFEGRRLNLNWVSKQRDLSLVQVNNKFSCKKGLGAEKVWEKARGLI